MRNWKGLGLALAVTACAALCGCAASEPVVRSEGYYVPTVGMIQRRGEAIPAGNLLASGDADIVIGRAEKYVEGPVQVGGISAYTTYTYDAQRLSDKQGSVGYRYRWVVQQGISVP